MSDVVELEFYNKKEVFEFESVARQANGAVLYKIENCVILATVVCEFDTVVEEDFMPLTVQYIEKSYAAAKIPGGFVKREGKPSDFETLTARIIDRSLRPLFPKKFLHPTVITVMVLSADENIDLQVASLKAASSALFVSDLPIDKSVSAIRLGKIGDELIINPSFSELQSSEIDLYIAGTKDDLLMIEMRAIATEEIVETTVEDFTKIHKMNDIEEEKLIELIQKAQDYLSIENETYEKSFSLFKKEKKVIKAQEKDYSKIKAFIKDNFSNEIKNIITQLAKKERNTELKELADKIFEENKFEDEIQAEDILKVLEEIKREFIRSSIVNDGVRADGRGPKDIREISIKTNILPSAHSSCLFTRGQTQALVVATIGNNKDAQMYDLLTSKSPILENFMVHYNFHGFSVGEAKPVFGVSRRELGHGNLAKRALECSIDKEFSDTVRLVSEILESNGSSSMATVCGGSLALKAAGIPISSLVAGIAMGAVFEGNKKVILTDIMGLEDHDGDMDFKVAGTKNGITALQMDIKLGGIELEFLKEALFQAKEARSKILDIMEEAAQNIVATKNLPLIEKFNIDPASVFSVIGKAGSVIKEIIEKFQVKVDVDKHSGLVKISGDNRENISAAAEHIKNISSNAKSLGKKETIKFDEIYSVGENLKGKVLRITDFGAFIELERGGEGLLHISKLSDKRVEKVTDVINIDDEIEVKVLNVSSDRIELSKIF